MKGCRLVLLLGALLVFIIPAAALAHGYGNLGKVSPGGNEILAKENYFLQGYTLYPHERWTTGLVTGWAEGDTVPFRIVVRNAVPGLQYQADIWFDYYMVKNAGLGEFQHAKGIEDLTNGAGETIDGHPGRMIPTNCTVDQVSFVGYEWAQNVLKGRYLVLYTATADYVTLEWRDFLAVTTPDTPGASHWPGASLDTRFAWGGSPPGERTVPIKVVEGGPGWEVGSVCGSKFYDANLNGSWDPGEPGVGGWLVKLFDETGTYLVDSTFTDSTGYYCFYNLVPGTYLVREILPPAPPRWVPTTPFEYLIVVESGRQVTGVDFGNFCLSPVGARTIGFWRNHPEEITQDIIDQLKLLPAFTDVDDIRDVLKIITPPWPDMTAKLRAQLLAMTLNVLSGKVSGGAVVYLGDYPLAAELLFGAPPPISATAQEILDAVEANYPWDGWDKDDKESVKDLLDDMNNDLLFVSPVPCPTPWRIGSGGGQSYGETRVIAPRPHLLQNYPNPFTSSTAVRYHVPASGYVSVKVYDSAGRLIKSLVDRVEDTGSRMVEWNGMDRYGREVSSGVYFCKLTFGEFSQAKKMVVVR